MNCPLSSFPIFPAKLVFAFNLAAATA